MKYYQGWMTSTAKHCSALLCMLCQPELWQHQNRGGIRERQWVASIASFCSWHGLSLSLFQCAPKSFFSLDAPLDLRWQKPGLSSLYFATLTASVKCSFRIVPAMLWCTAGLFLCLPGLPFIGFIGFVVAEEDCGSESCDVPPPEASQASDAFASLQVSQHEATHDGQTECSWLKSGPWAPVFFWSVFREQGGSETMIPPTKLARFHFSQAHAWNKIHRGAPRRKRYRSVPTDSPLSIYFISTEVRPWFYRWKLRQFISSQPGSTAYILWLVKLDDCSAV